MHFDWTTFALQTVNFAILVWLLNRFLYKPVLRIVDARRDDIERQYAAARNAEINAKETRATVKAERAALAAEQTAALKDAASQAEAAAAARHAAAEREATALLASTRKVLAAERDQALKEARLASLDLGAEIAARLLAEFPPDLKTEAWIARATKHLAVLPATELEALGRQLVDGSPLQIVTGSTLPAEAAERCRKDIRQILGDRIAVAFEVDPSLVAGAELRFPNASLRFSWQSVLAAMREETGADHR